MNRKDSLPIVVLVVERGMGVLKARPSSTYKILNEFVIINW
jgi:hypothetical protein